MKVFSSSQFKLSCCHELWHKQTIRCEEIMKQTGAVWLYLKDTYADSGVVRFLKTKFKTTKFSIQITKFQNIYCALQKQDPAILRSTKAPVNYRANYSETQREIGETETQEKLIGDFPVDLTCLVSYLDFRKTGPRKEAHFNSKISNVFVSCTNLALPRLPTFSHDGMTFRGLKNTASIFSAGPKLRERSFGQHKLIQSQSTNERNMEQVDLKSCWDHVVTHII